MADLNKIQFKRSKQAGLIPNVNQLGEGELAINLTDRSIFTSDGEKIISLGFAKGGQVDGDIDQISGGINTAGDIHAKGVFASEINLTSPISIANGGTGSTDPVSALDALGKGRGIGERSISITESIDLQQFVFISGATYQCYFENILNSPSEISYPAGTLVNLSSTVNKDTIILDVQSIGAAVYNKYSIDISNAQNLGLRSFKTKRFQNSSVIIPISEGGTGAADLDTARNNLNAVSKYGDTINGELKVLNTLTTSYVHNNGPVIFNNHDLNCTFRSSNASNSDMGINYTWNGNFGFVDSTNGKWLLRRAPDENWFFNGNVVISPDSNTRGSFGASGAGLYLNNAKTGITLLLQDDGNLTYNNNSVYHAGNKPSPADINAVNKSGDTMTGRLTLSSDLFVSGPMYAGRVSSQTLAAVNGNTEFNFANTGNGTVYMNRQNISTMETGGIGIRNFGAVHIAGPNSLDVSIQGMHMFWDDAGTGEGAIAVNKGTGSGGLSLRFVNASGAEESRIKFSNSGRGHFPGGLSAGNIENSLSSNSLVLGDGGSGVVGVGGPIEIYCNSVRAAHFDPGQCYFDRNIQAANGCYVNGGDLYQSNDSYSTYVRDLYVRSDIRVKTDLEIFENASDKLSKIGGYTYKQKKGQNDDGSDRYIQSAGLIAQEVQAVLPELVSADDDGMLRLNYNGVTGLNTAAINEHTKTIETLRNEINNLKYIIETLISQ